MAVLGLSVSAYAGGAQVLDHKMNDIDGKEVDLSKYKGEVVMIVNVASKCGLTPQYEQLVEVHKKYKDKGFTILGFPANNFMKQEPGTDAEIKSFCSTKFGVDFPMFSKISVKGDDKAPLYSELTSKESNGDFAGDITWNFEKFLVNKEGDVVARFAPRTKPDADEVVAAIEAELSK
jgi:glutathione peroxidase